MSIHTEKNVFLIPYWIVNTIERNHYTLDTVLNLEKLTDITSAEDLALTSLLNEDNSKVFGVNIYSPSLYQNWYKDGKVWEKFNTQIKPLEQLLHNEIDNRLFNEASLNSNYQEPFEIKDIDSKTFLVIIYPGYFGGTKFKEYQNKLGKELLKLFYVYEGYDCMTKRQIFEHYLNNL
jgi:hypothetical protein